MPLHKSGRAPRLDPTMISAPLGDFRHTMHIGRGGDAFGDTSFLSNCGPSSPESTTESFKSAPSPTTTAIDPPEMRVNNDMDDITSSDGAFPQLQHSESVSSFDLDLDLGPSILGDVLGVMDGLGLGLGLGPGCDGEEVFSTAADGSVSLNGAMNELSDVNGVKSKGVRPKVRFSDKKEEIIGRQFEVGGGAESEFGKGGDMSPVEGVWAGAKEMADKGMAYKGVAESTNHRADNSPSPSSSMSSEYEGVSPLDRRREDGSASEEECAAGEQGYTFEDESDDEIGL